MRISRIILEKGRENGCTRLLTRRSFLAGAFFLGAGLCLPRATLSAMSKERYISFYNTHTDERLRIPYSPSSIGNAEIQALEYLLRDFRTGEMHTIDTGLLDTLWMIQNICEKKGPYEVISGYRSPETNAFLRQNSSGVDANSLHMTGRAIDVRLTGLETRVLRDLALHLHDGGVGYYPDSNFVHIDTGRKRSWSYGITPVG